MRLRNLALIGAFCLTALGGCKQAPGDTDRPTSAREYPRAARPVSNVVSAQFSTEAERDNHKEAQTVMDLAAIGPGSSVADIGAGEGYYTVRLGARVGTKGRVLAQDIDGEAMKRLGRRVEHDRLDNVSIIQGAPDDPKLPANSFDRVMLVHMYHEVTEPYAFLSRMRGALRANGRVVVVDLDRPTDRHGIPPALLFCEFESTGFRLTQFVRKPEIVGYYAEFDGSGQRPEPSKIRPCRIQGGQVVHGQN
ncbi:class I SAM-dependent methyltransferase [Novosphingobium sp.]|uniref:class I SAM-dependent methyltransferase n=1 Tax=Novosphingobium sp. TaxID=1874826 RepID=UPI00260158D7|nr:class I SAM-dependent methyltransferase [Novosphingobium sp.]